MARTASGAFCAIGRPDVAGLEAGVIRIDVEAYDPAGTDPDDLGGQMAVQVMGADSGLGVAANLEEVRPLHGRGGYLVHHEGHARIGPDVAVLGAAGHVPPRDIDRSQGSVIAEPQRLDLGNAVRTDGGQVAACVASQETPLGVGKSHDLKAKTSSNIEVKMMVASARTPEELSVG